MFKCSKNTKLLVFFLSIIIGGFIGYKTYDIAISKTIFKFRIIVLLLTTLIILFSILGKTLIKKYDINEELVLDDEAEDYFADLAHKFKANIVVGTIIGALLLIVTIWGDFHMPVMLYVCGLFYFIVLFIYVFPLIDEIIVIIRMALEYHRVA